MNGIVLSCISIRNQDTLTYLYCTLPYHALSVFLLVISCIKKTNKQTKESNMNICNMNENKTSIRTKKRKEKQINCNIHQRWYQRIQIKRRREQMHVHIPLLTFLCSISRDLNRSNPACENVRCQMPDQDQCTWAI